MRIGRHLIPAGPLDQLVADAATARALGFDAAWTNQHPGGWDALGALTALHDGPAELGTAIVPTYPRHPVAMATEALTTQALTGGRLTLGLGPGHAAAITGEYGIPYAAPARHTREYLEVLRPLMRGEHVTHDGEFFTVDTALVVTAPEPPVLVAALGPRMLEVARDLADGTIAVWVRPATVAEYLVPRLGEGKRIAALAVVAVTTDPDGVRESVARDFAPVGDLPAYRAILDRGGLSGPADAVVAGDETAVLRELRGYREAGVTDLIVSPIGTQAEQDRVLAVAATLER